MTCSDGKISKGVTGRLYVTPCNWLDSGKSRNTVADIFLPQYTFCNVKYNMNSMHLCTVSECIYFIG